MTRILISGPPASGKTTLANDIAQRIGGEVIDFDAIAESFGSPGHDHSRDVAQRAHAEVDRRIRETAGPAVLIRSTPRAADRESVARAFRADATFVLTLPAEAAKERASQDSRPSWTAEAIDHWWSTFEPSEMDTSRSATLTGDQIGIAAMADAVTAPPAPVTGADGANPNPDGDAPLGEGGEKALRAERKRAADAEKRVNELAERVKQFEDQGKTAEQKAADERAALASERDTATVRALRYEVCEAKELPLAAARFLTGATKAEIEEAADAFKALGVATGKPATGLPPAPNAGREAKRPTGAEQGLAEAQKRFGKPQS